ncbi:heterokaryon incompatibility protein [Ilyonectria destructans]|nr:heterokaryon incompatibility protein [Ilyonectria destructans]
MAISYKRLNPSSREIRLLEIQPSHNLDDPIKCRLITVRHSKELEYIALSSLYGDPAETETIFASSRPVTIAAHLALALRYMRAVFYPGILQRCQRMPASRLQSAPRWLKHLFASNSSHLRDGEVSRPGILRVWLDFLCVNQNDEWEKSKQLSDIKYIYDYADLVVGWLGEKAEHTNITITTMEEIEEAMPPYWGEPSHRKSHPEDYSPTHVWTKSIQYMWDEGPNGEPPFLMPRWLGCVEFMTRPYFQRHWIVEEIATASFPAFLVGDTLVPWRQVLSLYRLMEEFKFCPSDVFPAHLRAEVASVPLETAQKLLDEYAKEKPSRDSSSSENLPRPPG